MKFRYKLENKFEKYTIPNLYLIVIICIVIGYVIRYLTPAIYDELLLIPYMVVVKHQFWRLFTWIFTIPYELTGLMMLFLPINLFFYYSLGRSLESYWGRFMYNLYVIGGAVFTDILVVLGGIYYYYLSPSAQTHIMQFQNGQYGDSVYAALNVTHFMLISIFLAFTVVGGDHMVYLYFVIPLKMKWMGYLDLILLGYYFLTGGIFTKLIVVGSVANYFIYAYLNKSKTMPTLKDRKRKREFVKATQKGYSARRRQAANGEVISYPGGSIIPPGTGNPEGITIHKCAVCGRTEVSNPEMEFRFCSKCEGNYEYCSEHLYTHQHVQQSNYESQTNN
ncbi:MAG: hypothetical protein J6M65_02440 [Eubacterium sp.]|nr:hypothetical protein [Eubacterium sp.]